MTGIVAAQYFAGGRRFQPHERNELEEVCKILKISQEVVEKLPIGQECRYVLVLATQHDLPDECKPERADRISLVLPSDDKGGSGG